MADDALDDVVQEIVALLGDMAGITQAPEHPPEGINDPPMVVTYYVRHVPTYSASYSHMISTVYADVLLARTVLPDVEAKARKYVLLGYAAIAGSVTLSTKASHCLLTEIIGPGDLPYQNELWFGVRYILEIKLTYKQLGISVAA